MGTTQEKPGTRPPSRTTPQEPTINVGLRSTAVIENDLLGQKQYFFLFQSFGGSTGQQFRLSQNES